MDLFKQIEIMKRINDLIKKEKTGNPALFSKKLGISRSQLYRQIEYLKDYNAPIKYKRTSETFYYTRPFDIILDFKVQDLSLNHLKETNGGSIFLNFLSVQFLRQSLV